MAAQVDTPLQLTAEAEAAALRVAAAAEAPVWGHAPAAERRLRRRAQAAGRVSRCHAQAAAALSRRVARAQPMLRCRAQAVERPSRRRGQVVASAWSGRGHRHGRHHVRRGAFALGFVAPYYYDDYATSYVADDDCYELQQVRTALGWQYRRVYVCD